MRTKRSAVRAIADTSGFIARESGRQLGELPDEIAVSVVTAAELELGVLRATDPGTRATRLRTLSRVRMLGDGLDGVAPKSYTSVRAE